MQVLIFSVILVVTQAANPQFRTIRTLASGIDPVGPVGQFFNLDTEGNYDFGYNEENPTGGWYHRERGDSLGDKIGSYGITTSDGKIRIVNYLADNYGFTADIKSNEPDLGSKNPAFTLVSKQIPDPAAEAQRPPNPEMEPLPYGYRLGIRKLVNPFPI